MKYEKSDLSAITQHVWVDKHDIGFQSISILALEPDLHWHLAWNPGM